MNPVIDTAKYDPEDIFCDDFQERCKMRAGPHAFDSSTNKYQFALGLCEESGEAAGLVKKHFYQGAVFDREKYIVELGDVLWYVAMSAFSIGKRLSELVPSFETFNDYHHYIEFIKMGTGLKERHSSLFKESRHTLLRYLEAHGKSIGPFSLEKSSLSLCVQCSKVSDHVLTVDAFSRRWTGDDELRHGTKIATVLVSLSICAEAVDATLSDAARAVNQKLKLRYPNGFTPQDAVKRADENGGGK